MEPNNDGAGPAGGARAGTRLLFVEDDEDYALFFRRLVRKMCGPVLLQVERDERGAMQALEHGDFDAIVSDWNLNPGSGTRVLERASRLRPRTLRVLLTHAPSSAVQSTPNVGDIANHVWDKGWATDTIQASLGRLLQAGR